MKLQGGAVYEIRSHGCIMYGKFLDTDKKGWIYFRLLPDGKYGDHTCWAIRNEADVVREVNRLSALLILGEEI